jgi:hypothetical protein
VVDRLQYHVDSICYAENLIYYSHIANHTRYEVLYGFDYWLWSR